MPMDYDDNDFHIHNVHLAGEGSSSVSPILRPYALLKFDNDNHLRFDSLVENEVFLGIAFTGQEDNQWIEEYSRSNVWSEATSSESVEMLLKSVEAVLGDTEEFNASDEPGSLATIMDPNSKQDDGSDCVIYAPNKPQDKFSGSNDCTSTTQSEDAKLSGGDLDSFAFSDKSNLHEEKVDRVCDVNQEAGNLAVDIDKNEVQSKVECGDTGSTHASEYSIKKKETSMAMDSPDTAVETCTYRYGDEKPSVVSNVDGHRSFGVSIPSTSLMTIGSCSLPITAECKAHVSSAQLSHDSKCASPVGSEAQELDDNMHEDPLAILPVTGLVKPQHNEDDNTKLGILASPESNVGSPSPSKVSDLQCRSVEETENTNGKATPAGSSIRDVGANLTNACSSPDLLGGSTLAHSQDMVDKETTELSGSVQVNDEIRSSELHGLFVDEDANSNEGGDARLPLDRGDLAIEVIGALDGQKNVESNSSREKTFVMAQGSEGDMTVLAEPDSGSVATGNESPQVASRVEPEPLSAGKIIHQVAVPSVESIKYTISEQAQAKVGANVEAGPEESLSGSLAVDMSAEQQASIGECNACHSRHEDDDKLQSVPPTSNTSNTEPCQSEKVTHEMASLPHMDGKLQSVFPDRDMKRDESLGASAADLGQPVACNLLMNMEGSSSKKPDEAPQVGGAKGNSERKTRQKSVGKESARKVTRRSGKVEKSTAAHQHHHVIQFDELKPKPKELASSTGILPLPDLNDGTRIFQQPFTDNQQVQLRAQILVYGSLISGTPPAEPYMVAAFGQSDGGRKTWEAAWHACLERERVCNPNNPATPMQSQSDLKDAVPSKDVSSSPSISNKATPPPVVSPLIPLWNISTPAPSGGMPRQSFSLNPPVAVAVQNHNPPPWLSQAGQWLASSPVSAFNAGTCFSALPMTMAITEAVKLTPVKLSGMKHTYPIPVVHSAAGLSDAKKGSRKRKKASVADQIQTPVPVPSQALTASVTAPPVAQLPCTNGRNHMPLLVGNPTNFIVSSVFSTSVATVSASASMTSPIRFLSIPNEECKVHAEPEDAGTWKPSSDCDSKSIKRKKVTSSHQTSIPRQAPHAHCHSSSFPTSVGMSTPVSISPGRFQETMYSASRAAEETLSKVEESKLQAENAALLAAAEVNHCQDVLESQKSCGDGEAKLMSSAVSIAAAAAAVAKMAATAAKITSDVAEQARLMADEVFLSSKSENSIMSHPNVVSKFDNIMKGRVSKSKNPNSIISVAREAAQRRIEAASAASKHAENLDAIVKAAELAAEAVSQAGKIVVMPMGDSSALRKLVEAGPEGYTYRKTSHSPVAYEVSGHMNSQNAESAPNETLKRGLAMQEHSSVAVLLADGSITIGNEKETRIPTRAHRGPNLLLSRAAGVALETETLDTGMPQTVWEQHNIKEGCLVEVYKDDGKYKGAWVAANVLSLKDEKALVSYTEIQSPDEGSKEWVSLEVEGSKVPGIRVARPMISMQCSKKRRRTAVTDYAWSNGDKVDVWMQDCWRMGIVTESKNKIDVSVQFPGQGETPCVCVVGSWNVRPSLVWKDGKWSSLKGVGVHASSSEFVSTIDSTWSETPKEKRMKVGSPAVKDKSEKVIDEVKVGRQSHEETGTLGLSGEESSFNVGRKDKKQLRNRMKSGAKVIFGVPKPEPGKKQKFMDVSKHYYEVAETKSRSRKPPVPSFRGLAGHKDKNLVLSSKPTTGTGDSDKSVGEVQNQKQMEFGDKEGFSFTSNNKHLNVEDIESTKPEAPPPRRSNRKIQPTSRLLEGLQTSLTIPSFSHTTRLPQTTKENANHG